MRGFGVLACLALSGCFFGFGGGDDVGGDDAPPAPTPAIVIAVGASVTPILDQYGCSGTTQFGHLCVDGSTSDITNVTVDSDAFSVGPVTDADYNKVLPITAHRAGDAHLRFEITTIIRTEYVDVLIRAAEIERTELAASCEDFTSGAEPRLAVASGVRFGVESMAFAGDDRLLLGTMELVEQADGFTLSEPSDNGRSVIAPAAVGTYTWRLFGGGEKTFVVYDVADLEPTLTAATAGIVVGRKVGDVKVCAHGRAERTMITVTSGACRAATDFAEIVGPMPIALPGQNYFELVADTAQSCELTATIESTGHVATGTFTATAPEVVPPTGTLIDATPVSLQSGSYGMGADCGGSLTDGDCDGVLEYPPVPYDGDCYIDSDWETEFSDFNGVIGDNEFVGTGLTVVLRLKVVANILGLVPFDVGPPQNLVLHYTSSELDVASIGCANNAERIAIKPLQSASILGHSLGWEASNLDDDGDMRIRVKDVTGMGIDGHAGSQLYYQNSTFVAAPTYFNGSSELRGVAPVTIEGIGNARRTGSQISIGDAGSRVTLSAAGMTQIISSVDETAFTGIRNFNFNDSVQRGLNLCKDLPPTGGNNQDIRGDIPKPRLSLSGPAFTIGRGLAGQFCLFGYAVGQSAVTVSWGSFSQTRNWTVQPGPFD